MMQLDISCGWGEGRSLCRPRRPGPLQAAYVSYRLSSLLTRELRVFFSVAISVTVFLILISFWLPFVWTLECLLCVTLLSGVLVHFCSWIPAYPGEWWDEKNKAVLIFPVQIGKILRKEIQSIMNMQILFVGGCNRDLLNSFNNFP